MESFLELYRPCCIWVPKKKKTHTVWNGIRISKWWQTLCVWVNCPFNCQNYKILLSVKNYSVRTSSLLNGKQIFLYSLIDIYMLTINDTWVFLWRGEHGMLFYGQYILTCPHSLFAKPHSLVPFHHAPFKFTGNVNQLMGKVKLGSWPQNQRAMFDLTWPFQWKMFSVQHVLLWKTVKSSDGGCKFLIPSPTLSTTVRPYNVGSTKAVSQVRGQEVMKLILYLVCL